MTMHLIRGMSSLNTKKRKQKKLTNAEREKLEIQWRQYNKDMRRKHMHSCQFESFDDYVAYVKGTYKIPSSKKPFQEYQPAQGYRRETQHIPSAGMGIGVATKKESQRYTGDLIAGIATMHKSNAVPVMKGTKEAEDIANMRRN